MDVIQHSLMGRAEMQRTDNNHLHPV